MKSYWTAFKRRLFCSFVWGIVWQVSFPDSKITLKSLKETATSSPCAFICNLFLNDCDYLDQISMDYNWWLSVYSIFKTVVLSCLGSLTIVLLIFWALCLLKVFVSLQTFLSLWYILKTYNYFILWWKFQQP